MRQILSVFITAAFSLVVWSLASFVSISDAAAGDCRQVRFQITNGFASRIRILSVRVVGNDGTWLENIGNKTVYAGSSHTTNRRRMNKLDSGQTGTFTVNFKVWDAANSRWAFPALPDATLSRRCDDGDVIRITVRPYSG